jgi:hypothetical protein
MPYVAGAWKCLCDRCGFALLNTDLRMEWTGLRVCKTCLDPRHSQDHVQGRVDKQNPPWTRPEAADSFTVSNDWDDL